MSLNHVMHTFCRRVNNISKSASWPPVFWIVEKDEENAFSTIEEESVPWFSFKIGCFDQSITPISLCK
jgi:hypothetical protein